MFIRFLRAIAAVCFTTAAILAFSAAAEAAANINFVASNGNDANPCTAVTAPCKTLQRAVNVTPANGTVRVLTSLQSSATINKNITISGDGATIVGTIVISGASTIVTLRGLELNGVRYFANGIRIDSAAAVHIEDCTVERYTNDGIKLVATTATKLFVSDTVVRASSDGLYADDVNAQVVIENSRFEGNASTGLFLKVAKATVLRSVSSGNVANGIILRTSNAKVAETTANENGASGMYSDLVSAKVEIENSRFEGNASTGLSLQVATANVTRSVASGNAGNGISLQTPMAKITETMADDNSQNGFHVQSGDATFSSSETNGNGAAGLYIPAGTTATIIDCALYGLLGFNNLGTLYSHNSTFSDFDGYPVTSF